MLKYVSERLITRLSLNLKCNCCIDNCSTNRQNYKKLERMPSLVTITSILCAAHKMKAMTYKTRTELLLSLSFV